MKSGTSFFNARVLQKHITRFLPVWALYLLGCVMVLPGMVTEYPPERVADDLDALVNLMGYLNFAYGLICAEMLFGDLFHSRLCNALHAMPLRREGWFFTGTVAGCCFSFLPNLVLALCFLPRLGAYGSLSFLWMLAVDLEFLFFFGVAVFCMLCVGNRFAGALLYGLLNFLPLLAGWLVEALYLPLLPGVVMNWEPFHWATPLSWFANYGGFLGRTHSEVGSGYLWTYLTVLAGLGVTLLGVALWFYRKRKLECAGDFAAIRGLKPIFLVVFTLSAGAIFHLFCELFLDGYLWILFLLVGMLTGYLSATMLLRRTVRVFSLKTCVGYGVITAVLLGTMGLTTLDPLGMTQWVPEEDRIEKMQISLNTSWITSDYGIQWTGEEVSEGIRLHRQLLKSKTESGTRIEVHLTYHLKNGKKVRRVYRIGVDSTEGTLLRQYLSAPEVVLKYQDWESWLDQVTAVWVEDESFSGKEARELLIAMRKDCEKGAMAQSWEFHQNSDGGTDVASWCQIEQENTENPRYLTIYADAEETIRWLNQRKEN